MAHSDLITRRLVQLGSLSLIILAATGGTGYWAISDLDRQLADTRQLSLALRTHADADQLHDALRGDVFEAASQRDPRHKGRQNIDQYTSAHASDLKNLWAANDAANLPKDVVSARRSVQPALYTYAELAKNLVQSKEKGNPNFREALSDFSKRFENLEPRLGGITERLQKHVAVSEENGRQIASMARLAILTGSCIGLALLLIAFLVTNRAILRISKQLHAARLSAERAALAEAEFLATMSHEIRTPLNGVIGMTGLLLETKLSRQQRGYAEIAQCSGEALLSVINDILDFSKIDAGKMELEEIDFDLCELVEGVTGMIALSAAEKGLELASLINHDLPLRLRGDPHRIRQILGNLASNAVKFTERGEIVVRAKRVEDDERGVVVRFEVQDTGVGVAPEQQSKLFEAFKQADASTTRKYGGTGLGLAISAKLTKLMGGEIGVENVPGGGSNFWFTVPMGRATTEIPKRVELRGRRVLVVDDNSVNRDILHQHILGWDMRNGSAESGSQALNLPRAAAARGEHYDVAILDMQMPQMNGLELARLIKADPAIASVRLIILSSIGDHCVSAACAAAGVDSYLTKPARQSELYDCLAQTIAKASSDSLKATGEKNHRGSIGKLPGGSSDVRILIAEDHPVNQQVALGVLANLGYVVDVVASGSEAVAGAASGRYAAILMDCQMPQMDGYTATRAIRSAERGGEHLPIIALTADVGSDTRAKCLDAGMDDYITKPIDPPGLCAVLQRWLTNVDQVNPPVDPAAIDMLRKLETTTPGLVDQVIELFLRDTSERLNQLLNSAEEEDPLQMALIAHTIRGAAANLGAGGMVAVCKELEKLANGGELDGAKQRAATLSREFERVQSSLAEFAKAS